LTTCVWALARLSSSPAYHQDIV